LVGVSFASILLRRDGWRTPIMCWSAFRRHVDHLIETLGEEHFSLGSDFNGAIIAAMTVDVRV
jgi:membrane dipeptidase